MSIYICGYCEKYKDADVSGCNEHPFNEWENLCDECDEKIAIEMEEPDDS
jgi:hypothetical protein